MAIQTIYLLGTTSVTPNWWGNTQLNGSAPTAANSAYGWGPAKVAVTTPYTRGRLGATGVSTDTAIAASYNAATTGPTKGTGSGANTAGDSFVSGPFYGTFAATAWTFNCNLRAGTAGAVGHINLRVWRSANADGSTPTQLVANTAGTTVTLSTTADVNSAVTFSPGSLVLVNQYLFFQVEWQETTAGTSNNDNVLFRIGTASITTADFVAAAIGTLAATQADQTVASTGNVPVVGTLARTEISDTFAGTGGPRVGGTLARTEISDTFVGAGGPIVGGTLALTEISDTLAATGTVGSLGSITGDLGGVSDTITMLLVHADGTAGSTTFIDSSPKAHPLTANSTTVSTVAPKFGTGAADFTDSSAACIDIGGNASDFNFGSGPFTVEAWGYITFGPWSYIQPIIAQFSSATSPTNSGWIFGIESGLLTFAWTTNGTTLVGVSGSVTWTHNTWYHIAVDRDASNTLRLYVNGAIVYSTDFTGVTIFPSTLNGVIGNYNSTASQEFPGHLDEIRVTKGLARYGGAFTPPIQAFSIGGGLTQAAQTIAASGLVYPLSLIAQASSGGVNNFTTTTPAVDTTGANLLVVHFSHITYNPPTLSDNKGNTWTQLYDTPDNASSPLIRSKLYYVNSQTPNVGPGHTVSVDGGASYPAANFMAWRSNTTWGLSVSGSASGNLPHGTGGVTTGTTNELLISAASSSGASFFASVSQGTILGNLPYGGTYYSTASAYKIVPTAGTAIDFIWTADSVVVGAVIIQAFSGTWPDSDAPSLAPITGGLGGIPDTTTMLLVHCDGTAGSTTFVDSSPKAHTLSSNVTVNSTAKFGSGSANFNTGSDNAVIDTGNATDFQFGSAPFTVEAWVYPTITLTTNLMPVVTQWGGIAGTSSWYLAIDQFGVEFNYSTTGSNTLNYYGLTTIALNTWTHIAVDFDGSTLRLYANGVVLTSTTGFSGVYASSTVTGQIGYNGAYGPATPFSFHGYLDEIRVTKGLAQYGGAFTPATQAFSIGSGGLTQANQTLAASGTVVSGLRGQMYALPFTDRTWAEVKNNTAVADQAGFSLATTPQGDIGALSDGSTTAHISYPLNAGTQPPQTWSLEVLVYLSGIPTAGNHHGIAGWALGAGNTLPPVDRIIWMSSSAFEVFQNGADGFKTVDAGTPVAGQKFHLIATQTGTSLQLYVNGVAGTATPTTTGGEVDYSTPPYLRLGVVSAGDQALHGTILLCNFANVAWTPTEVAARVANPYGFLTWSNDAFGSPTVSQVAGGAVTGTLAVTQANQTLTAAGQIAVGGILSVTEAVDTIVATGGPRVGGTLTATQTNNTLSGVALAAALGTLTATEALDTIVAAGGPRVGGTLTATEALDTIAAIGGPRVDGTLTANQAAHTIVAAGGPIVGGTLTANQAAQTIVAAGGPRVGGILSTTQAANTIASAGGVAVSGTLTANQAAQTIAATGSALTGIGGSLNVAQANQTLVATGTVPFVVSGTLSVTQATQTLVAAGGPRVGGILSATEALDTIAATGGVVVGGSLSVPQAAQTLVAVGGPIVGGTLGVTEVLDTIAATGGAVVGGTLTVTEALDTIAATGGPVVRGTLTANQAPQTIAATGSIVTGASATLNVVQAAQTIAATGTVVVNGTLSVTEAVDTIAANAGVRVGATLGVTQANQTLSANAGVRVSGALSVTEALDTISAAGSVTVRGTLSVTEALDTISAIALQPAIGILSVVQQSQILVATGSVRDRVLPSFPVYDGQTNGRYIVSDEQGRVIVSANGGRVITSNPNYRTAPASSPPVRTLSSVGR